MSKILKTFGWTAVIFIKSAIFIYVMHLLRKAWDIDREVNEAMANSSRLLKTLFKSLLFPILEELAFRLSILYSYKKARISAIAALAIFLIELFFFDITNPVIVLTMFFSLALSFVKSNENLRLYVYMFLFAIAHNHTHLYTQNIVYHLVVFTNFFISGFIYSIIRKKYGFGYGILAHLAHNSIPFLLIELPKLLMRS